MMKVLGISGWSGCGKTTLIVSLILRLKAQGLTVSTLKYAHHEVDLDTPGKDTYRHREAGAREVLLCTPRRWVLQHELVAESEPTLSQLLATAGIRGYSVAGRLEDEVFSQAGSLAGNQRR